LLPIAYLPEIHDALTARGFGLLSWLSWSFFHLVYRPFAPAAEEAAGALVGWWFNRSYLRSLFTCLFI
jgi:hypothetical protein